MVDHADLDHTGLTGVSGAGGWAPVAYPINYNEAAALTTAVNLVANGGSIAIPIFVPSQLLLEAVTLRNTDTTSARTWGWDLYQQVLNSGDSAQNALARVVASNGDESFTAAAASTRGLDVASKPQLLLPGIYWLVVQNTHASNTFGVASTATGHAFGFGGPNQQKTTTNPNGATLDFVAATWTKDRNLYGVWLRGRVFGETTQF